MQRFNHIPNKHGKCVAETISINSTLYPTMEQVLQRVSNAREIWIWISRSTPVASEEIGPNIAIQTEGAELHCLSSEVNVLLGYHVVLLSLQGLLRHQNLIKHKTTPSIQMFIPVWVDFPSWESAWEKPPCHPQSLLAKVPPVISMRTLLGCSWLLNILKLYTQHLSLRHLMPVCSWSLDSIHPRLPWWNFIWHREMQVAKTKRFRTAEINSPISERSTDTNCKRSSNRIRYAVGTRLLRFGLWRWTQSVWMTWLSTN